MPIPDFQALFRPVLEVLADGQVWTLASLRDAVAAKVGVSGEDREVRIGSGGRQYDGRIHWAVTYLNQAKALSRVGRGVIQISPRGLELLAGGPEHLDVKYLMQFPEFQDFYERARASQKGSRSSSEAKNPEVETVDPLEQISAAVEEIDAATAAELVERIKAQTPDFLERLILELMLAMGYGSIVGKAEHLGGSGDEGFDGVVHQDALGLERVYLQAKRYTDNTVGRPAIQAFAGALQGAGASRGVFITTSKFSAEAREFAARIPARVVLIDGPELGRLLVRYRVGVQVKQSFDVVEVDEDFFE